MGSSSRKEPEIVPPLSQPRQTTSTISKPIGTTLETAIFITVILIVHALYITTQTKKPIQSLNSHVLSSHQQPILLSSSNNLPDLFIYRRTRKTGSSSMINALLKSIVPLGYVPLKEGEHEVDIVVRNEYVKPLNQQRKLFVVHHNQVNKLSHPNPSKVIIADTFRDGFETITSYCRQKQKISTCNSKEMIPCLQSTDTLLQNHYRFTNSPNESDYTYIDLPLSSKHVALSTSVLKTVFPTMNVLQIDLYNVHESACDKSSVDQKVIDVYNELYSDFNNQVIKLQQRMLGITGYPFVASPNEKKKKLTDSNSTLSNSSTTAIITLDDMLDAAEELEKVKYEKELSQPKKVQGKPVEIMDLLKSEQAWKKQHGGQLVIVPKRKSLQ